MEHEPPLRGAKARAHQAVAPRRSRDRRLRTGALEAEHRREHAHGDQQRVEGRVEQLAGRREKVTEELGLCGCESRAGSGSGRPRSRGAKGGRMLANSQLDVTSHIQALAQEAAQVSLEPQAPRSRAASGPLAPGRIESGVKTQVHVASSQRVALRRLRREPRPEPDLWRGRRRRAVMTAPAGNVRRCASLERASPRDLRALTIAGAARRLATYPRAGNRPCVGAL